MLRFPFARGVVYVSLKSCIVTNQTNDPAGISTLVHPRGKRNGNMGTLEL